MPRLDTAEGNRAAAKNADWHAADVEMYEGFAREARRTADDIDRKSA